MKIQLGLIVLTLLNLALLIFTTAQLRPALAATDSCTRTEGHGQLIERTKTVASAS